jgi:hypothetical protein
MSRMPSSAMPSASGWKPGAQIGFEAMHESIDACRRRDSARQPDGQLCVGDHHARHHLRMENDFFLVSLLVEDDARPANLGPGARRRRDRDDGRDAGRIGPGPPVADILEIPERSGLARHEGHSLAGIERRTAAERHDAVMLAGAICGQSRLDVAGRRDCRALRRTTRRL